MKRLIADCYLYFPHRNFTRHLILFGSLSVCMPKNTPFWIIWIDITFCYEHNQNCLCMHINIHDWDMCTYYYFSLSLYFFLVFKFSEWEKNCKIAESFDCFSMHFMGWQRYMKTQHTHTKIQFISFHFLNRFCISSERLMFLATQTRISQYKQL